MTAPQPVFLVGTSPTEGCTAPNCGTQDTVLLHPHHGRQCPEHITLPPGSFRRDLADDMFDLGHVRAAWQYLAAYLAREARDRCAAAVGRLP